MTSNSEDGFHDPLDSLDPEVWHVASHVNGGDWLRTGWDPGNVVEGDGQLRLLLEREGYLGKWYSGAEISSNAFHGYGRYEFVMQPSADMGVTTGFFLYTGEFFGDEHNEIDFEFVGKEPTKAWLGHHVNHENTAGFYDLGFDATAAPHTYAIEWEPDAIRWYAEDRLLREETSETSAVPVPDTPSKIYVNIWHGLPGWMGPPEFGEDAEASVSRISYQPLAPDGSMPPPTWEVEDGVAVEQPGARHGPTMDDPEDAPGQGEDEAGDGADGSDPAGDLDGDAPRSGSPDDADDLVPVDAGEDDEAPRPDEAPPGVEAIADDETADDAPADGETAGDEMPDDAPEDDETADDAPEDDETARDVPPDPEREAGGGSANGDDGPQTGGAGQGDAPAPTETPEDVPEPGDAPGFVREVALFYEAALGRAPDRDGFNWWIDAREEGLGPEVMADSFAVAAASAASAGADDRAFVDWLYGTVFDTGDGGAGAAFWTEVLADGGAGRGEVLRAFAETPENVAGAPYLDRIIEDDPGVWDF